MFEKEIILGEQSIDSIRDFGGGGWTSESYRVLKTAKLLVFKARTIRRIRSISTDEVPEVQGISIVLAQVSDSPTRRKSGFKKRLESGRLRESFPRQ
jgi:hypothetical protein